MGSTSSRLKATKKWEQKLYSSYPHACRSSAPNSRNQRQCTWDTYLLRGLVKLSPAERRAMIDINYRLTWNNNTIVAVLLQRLRTDRDAYEFELEVDTPAMRSLLQDLIYLLKESKGKSSTEEEETAAASNSSSSAVAGGVSPQSLRSRSIRAQEVHAYRTDDTDESTVPITLIEAISCLPYDKDRIASLLPELQQLMEFALSQSTRVGNPSANLILNLIEWSPQGGKTILPLIMMLRKSVQLPEGERLWKSLFSSRSYEFELFLNWILLESDPSIFSLDCPTLVEVVGDEERRKYETPMFILAEIIEQLRAYRHSNTAAEAAALSSSPSFAPSVALLSLHSYVRSTLESLPFRMFTACILLQPFIRLMEIAQAKDQRISNKGFPDGLHNNNNNNNNNNNKEEDLSWIAKDMHALTEKLCQAIEEEFASTATVSSASSSSSSSSSSSPVFKRVIRLSEMSSSTTLLHCLLSCPTATLKLFDSPQYPHARAWFISELKGEEMELLITKTNSSYTLLQLMLFMHRPSESDDFIYQIYDSLLEIIFGLPSEPLSIYDSALILPTPSDILRQLPGGLNAYRHLTNFVVRPSLYISVAKNDPWKSHTEPRYHVSQVRLILDLFAKYNLKGDLQLKVDFFTHFIGRCQERELKQWIEFTRDTTDTLWPERLEGMNQTIVRVWQTDYYYPDDNAQPHTLKALASILSAEAKRWREEVSSKYESMVEEHLIPDLAGVVISYLSAGPPLSIEVRDGTHMLGNQG